MKRAWGLGLALAAVVGCSDEAIVAALKGAVPSVDVGPGAWEPEADWGQPAGAADDVRVDDAAWPGEQPLEVEPPSEEAESASGWWGGAADEAPEPAASEPVAPSPPPRAAPSVVARIPAPSPAAADVDLLALDLPGQRVITYPEVPGLVGKTVYPVVSFQLRGKGVRDLAVYAGEPLTLVEAEVFREEPLRFNYVRVRKADGREGELQLEYLSQAPLNYDLTHVEDAEQLLLGACREAVRAGVALHLHMARFDYAFPDDRAVHDSAMHARNTYEKGFKYSQYLVRSLVHGSSSSTDHLMRNLLTRWTAVADDPRVLAWFEDGIPDPALKKRRDRCTHLLSSLANLSAHGFKLARLEAERERAGWLRGMDDLPPEAVERLNQKKLGELDGRRDQTLERRQQSLTKANAAYAEIFGG